MNDVAFRAHAIQASMEQMLHAAALPILSDVSLQVRLRTLVKAKGLFQWSLFQL